jgi:hypothetical protein
VVRHVLTALSAVGWIVAVVLILRLRDVRGHAPAVPGHAPVGERLRDATGHVAGTLAGGIVAGVLVLGLGGRLMMRVLAATSPAASQGLLTDAQEVVGEVTVSGTLGFLVFVGVLGGAVGAILYATIRRWLPQHSLAAGLVAGGIGGGILARPSGLLDPGNHDFAILEPRWLAVALCGGLLVTFVLLGAALIDRFAPTWPRPSPSFRGAAGLLPLLPLLLVPPFAAWILVAIGVRTARPPGAASAGATGGHHLLAAVFLVAGGLGGLWVVTSATQILTA